MLQKSLKSYLRATEQLTRLKHQSLVLPIFTGLEQMSTSAPSNLKANTVTRQLTSISENKLPCLGKNKMCNKETTAPYMTPGAQLTNKTAITLVTLSFLVPNFPAKTALG